MRCAEQLPQGYEEILRVDLQKNKKTALAVNGLALLIAAVMVLAANRRVPIGTLFDMEAGLGPYALRFGALVVGMVGYIFLHELVHGAAFRYYSGHKAFYGFTGMYAYAGSRFWYARGCYLVIALAPVVVWGVVLLAAGLFLEGGWFWVVYMIQICNLSGAAGDLWLTVRLLRMPDDILIRDDGVGMTICSAKRS